MFAPGSSITVIAVAPARRNSSGVPSVEPPSTTITSSGRRVCAATDARNSSTCAERPSRSRSARPSRRRLPSAAGTTSSVARAVAAQVNVAARCSPRCREVLRARRVRQHASRAPSAISATSVGVDQQRRRRRRPRGATTTFEASDRHAARHRLEHRQPEPLVERRIRERVRAPVQQRRGRRRTSLPVRTIVPGRRCASSRVQLVASATRARPPARAHAGRPVRPAGTPAPAARGSSAARAFRPTARTAA